MQKKLFIPLLFIVLLCTTCFSALAQESNKIWFDGLGRSFFARDVLGSDAQNDTISTRNSSNGYNLLDLNTHINPLKNIEIFAQLRIRNTFGGFFGSGTSIDVRQLRAKGTIKNKIRFSVGDLFLKQSRFTLFNYDEDLTTLGEDGFNVYRDVVHYENFYIQNRWRLQGIQSDFSFNFDRFIRTLEFDFFITRPRGSSQINTNSFSSDLLLSGATIGSRINKTIYFESNYINLFEIPSSGTQEKSIRNPVYRIAVTHFIEKKKYSFKQNIEGGFSERHWLISNENAPNKDSISNSSSGMYFEFSSNLIKKDSLFNLSVGYRYVDPNFRSAAAQTRRLNLLSNTFNTVYPTYTNDELTRPTSLFDLTSDENLYNQDISGTLMNFNPIYSNVLPYGDATPNRIGLFLNSNYRTINNFLEFKVNGGFFNEVIGQGTPEKRNFSQIKANAKLNLNMLLDWTKEISLSISTINEITQRNGDSIERLDFKSNQLNLFLSAELIKKLFLQFSFRNLNVKGNEYTIVRDDFGTINNFLVQSYDLEDNFFSVGLFYKIRKNVYANLQYNWWGTTFSSSNPNFNYRRLLFILSVKL